jgi:hypothetical protein
MRFHANSFVKAPQRRLATNIGFLEITGVVQMRRGQLYFARQPCLQSFNLSDKSELQGIAEISLGSP